MHAVPRAHPVRRRLERAKLPELRRGKRGAAHETPVQRVTSRQPAPQAPRPSRREPSSGNAGSTAPAESAAQPEFAERGSDDSGATIARQTLRALNRCHDALQVEAALEAESEREAPRPDNPSDATREAGGTSPARELSRLELAAVAERERVMAGTLTTAAAELVGALDVLVDSPIVWDYLVADARELAARPIRRQDLAAVEEIVAASLPDLLRALGYRPPPTAGYWVQAVQDPLRDALHGSPDAPVLDRAVADARQELRFLVYRLRALIQRSYAALSENAGTGEGLDELARARRLLSNGLRGARSTVVPAAIAAGAVAAVFVAPHVAFGAAVLAVAGGAGEEGLRRVVEAAATKLLAAPSPASADPQVELRARMAGLHRALSDLLTSHDEDSRENVRFIARRWVYRALATAETDGGSAWERAYPLLYAIDHSNDSSELLAYFNDFARSSGVEAGPDALWNQMWIHTPPYAQPLPDAI